MQHMVFKTATKRISTNLETGMRQIVIKEGVTEIPDEAYIFFDDIEEVTLPEGIKRIGRSAFQECVNLRRINFPASLEEIDFAAFCNCLSLILPPLPSAVKIGEMAFHHVGAFALGNMLEKKGQLIAIAARPGMGKTALAIHMAIAYQRATNNRPVHYLTFACEEAPSQMDFVARFCRANPFYLQWSHPSYKERQQAPELQADTLVGSPLSVDSLPTADIAALIEHLAALADPSLVVIEDERRLLSSYDFALMQMLKEMAKTKGINILYTTTIGREVEEREDHRPTVETLPSLAPLSQMADVLLLPYRPHYYDETAQDNTAEVIVAKSGVTIGTISLIWHRATASLQ